MKNKSGTGASIVPETEGSGRCASASGSSSSAKQIVSGCSLFEKDKDKEKKKTQLPSRGGTRSASGKVKKSTTSK